jgi:hypothetical protein
MGGMGPVTEIISTGCELGVEEQPPAARARILRAATMIYNLADMVLFLPIFYIQVL